MHAHAQHKQNVEAHEPQQKSGAGETEELVVDHFCIQIVDLLLDNLIAESKSQLIRALDLPRHDRSRHDLPQKQRV
jgi:hypothetical protein